MLRREDRTAVLVGLNGCIKSSDFPGRINDVDFVGADEGTEHRQVGDRVGAADGVQRLGCHLTQGLSGNEAPQSFSSAMRLATRIIMRRMMMVKNSSGQSSLMCSWISVNGTMKNFMLPAYSATSYMSSVTFCSARALV